MRRYTRKLGKCSWYGGPRDSQDNNQTASGIPNTVPGIAVLNRDTLRGYWLVRMYANGRSHVVQQIEIGPAHWTGRIVDINYTAVRKFGYSEANFPTDSRVEMVWLDTRNRHLARMRGARYRRRHWK